MNFKKQYQDDGRPTFENLWVRVAELMSLRGDCRRRQVGAVLVLEDNHTHYTGWNGTKEKKQPGCLSGACPRGLLSYEEYPGYELGNNDYSNCISLHAEANALKSCLKNGGDPTGATMYISCKPCEVCQQLLQEHHVYKIIWCDGYLDLSPPKMS